MILRGRVVDARGEPIYWAGIWVKRMRAPDVASGPPYEWVDEWQTQTDLDGRFQLLGDRGPGDYRLRVAQAKYLERDDVLFRPNGTELVIVLRKSGGLEGGLRAPEGVPPEWLRVSAEGDARSPSEPLRPRPDGKFFLLDLAPGEVDVSVRVPAWPEPLTRVPRVVVEDGVTRADPRLASIDLRESLFRIDLDVRDEGGAPVPLGRVAFTTPDGEEMHHAFTDGSASLLAPVAAGRAEVIAPGFRPQLVAGARDGTRVVLQRGIPVRVGLPRGFELPGAPLRLVLQLLPARMEMEEPLDVHADDGTRTGPWGRAIYGVEASFVDSTDATLYVGGPGEWQPIWRVESERGSAPVRGEGTSANVLRIDEHGASAAFELSPDPDELARAITSLR